MKTTILILATLIFSGFAAMAQETGDDQMRTVFGSDADKIDHGGYGAFTMGYTKIDDKDAILVGGRGGWLIDHHFTIGLAGYGFFNNLNSNNNYDISNYTLAGGYGGLFLEPIIAPNFPVHVAFPILIGAGGASAFNEDYWDSFENTYYYDGSAFFVFEPGMEVELNIVKFFRISFGASYRYTGDLDLTYSYYDDVAHEYRATKIAPDALKNWNATMSLKFGWF